MNPSRKRKSPWCRLYGNQIKNPVTKVAAKALARQLLIIDPEVFICYQQNILDSFQKVTTAFHSKTVDKHFGWTNTLASELLNSSYIQDGDGDGVFT